MAWREELTVRSTGVGLGISSLPSLSIILSFKKGETNIWSNPWFSNANCIFYPTAQIAQHILLEEKT